jgi:hypothetical protein
MRDEIARIRSKMVHMDERGAAAARARIAALRAQIAALRDRTVYVNVVRRGGASLTAGGTKGLNANVGADGTTVPKTGLPYADRHHYLLADGEEVVTNRHGEADLNRRVLKAINNGLDLSRIPLPPGYASGGTVGSSQRVSVAPPNVNTGDVYVRMIVDGKEMRGMVSQVMDERDDVSGSYQRAARSSS